MSEKYKVIRHGYMIAECVSFGELLPGIYPYYLSEPFSSKNNLPHYRNLEKQLPDTLVWVVYSHRQDNPWIKRVKPEKSDTPCAAVRGLINSFNSDFTMNE